MEDLTKTGAYDSEETRWGNFYTVYHALRNDKHTKVKILKVNAGQNISYQVHHRRGEIWQVSKGAGTVVIDGKYKAIVQGDFIHIPQGSWHSLKAGDGTEIEIVEIQYGEATEENDIARLYYDWNDITKYVKEVL